MARRTPTRPRSGAGCGALLAAAALSLSVPGHAAAEPADPPAVPSAPAAPATPAAPAAPAAEAAPSAASAASPAATLPQLLERLTTYYQQAEAATEAYNRAEETAGRQRTAAERADRQLADQRVEVAAARDAVGLVARRMYQDGGVSPFLSLLAGRSPQDFFGQRHILLRAAGHQQDVLAGLRSGEARLKDLNAGAQRALDAAQHTQRELAARKKEVEDRLKQVEQTLSGLTGPQLDGLQSLEEQDDGKAQQRLLDSDALGDATATRAPSAAGDRAVGYAFAQLGKPYVWGAEGPDAFDCSGLTSQAWAHAGVTVPRTSQGQWAGLTRVPMGALRPGDVVIYFAKATHAALYIGDGLVIEAPRPGASVKVAPVGADPVLGAVRPDPGMPPMADYRPRAVPEQATGPIPIAPVSRPPMAPAVSASPEGTAPAAPLVPSAPPARQAPQQAAR